MGPARYMVRFTSNAQVRSKFRFVADESAVLQAFAEATRDEMAAEGSTTRDVTMTARTLVAFWGRVLSSLNNRRSRRKLSADGIGEREQLADKLGAAARIVSRQKGVDIERELQTRRTDEAAWMRERLAGETDRAMH